MIKYAVEPDLDPIEFIEVLRASTLGERRPIDDVDRMTRMLRASGAVLTARDGGRLVGVARALTDYSYCCYLADLAVAADHQNQGIGRRLIAELQQHLGDEVMILLLHAPAAKDYYPHIGFSKVENAWMLQRKR